MCAASVRGRQRKNVRRVWLITIWFVMKRRHANFWNSSSYTRYLWLNNNDFLRPVVTSIIFQVEKVWSNVVFGMLPANCSDGGKGSHESTVLLCVYILRIIRCLNFVWEMETLAVLLYLILEMLGGWLPFVTREGCHQMNFVMHFDRWSQNSSSI